MKSDVRKKKGGNNKKEEKRKKKKRKSQSKEGEYKKSSGRTMVSEPTMLAFLASIKPQTSSRAAFPSLQKRKEQSSKEEKRKRGKEGEGEG
jgi:hypothetical protein